MQLTKDEIKNLQRALKSCGFDPGPIDGEWGPKTEAAYQLSQKAHDKAQPSETNRLRTFDSRSEANIMALVSKAQVAARKFLAAVIDARINARIISGNRTWAEQDALFAKRPPVTRAKGGYSNHNFGIAWDIGIFEGGAYLPESSLYAQAGQIGRAQGLEWGGDWRSFKDEPHFNLKTGMTMTQLRSAFLKGEAYV